MVEIGFMETRLEGAVIIYDRDGGGRDRGVGLKKIQYPKRGSEKLFILERGPEIFCVLQAPKMQGAGDSTLIRFHPIVPPFKS